MHDDSSSSSSSGDIHLDNHPDIKTLLNNGIPAGKGPISSSSYCPIVEGTDGRPFVRLFEQPQARGFRFRYECEGPSHGGIQGESSEKNRKTYPSIKVENYRGAMKVLVTLVTDENIPKAHAHKLVGKHCEKGNCVMEIKGGNMLIQFPNLCIQHVTRKKAVGVLEEKLLESHINEVLLMSGSDTIPHQVAVTEEEMKKIRKVAEKQAKDMQLNVVRLCFTVTIPDDSGHFTRVLQPVVSSPIYDSKSPGASALKICRMDKFGGCCTGNEEVFLLCEKVQKDDIGVRFAEQDDDGNLLWEGFGDFGPMDVHRQYAIVFKTPPYHDQNIDKAVNVMIMLHRKSDDAVSEPKAFTYYPKNRDKDGIDRKRKKKINLGDGNGGYGGMDGGGGPGGNGGGKTGGRSINDLFSNGSMTLPNFTYIDQLAVHPDRELRALLNGWEQDPILSEFNDMLETDSGGPPPQTSATPKTYGQDVCLQSALKDDKKQPGVPPHDSNIQMNHNINDVSASPVTRAQETSCMTGSLPTFHPAGQPVGSTDQSALRSRGAGPPSMPYSPVGSRPSVNDQPDVNMNNNLKTLPENLDISLKFAEKSMSALVSYATSGDVRYLLLVQRHLLSNQDSHGDTPLHLAVINKQAEAAENIADIMSSLPNAERRINVYNNLSQTPLTLAVVTGQSYIVECLLRRGANILKGDRNGCTPIHLAITSKQISLLKLLLDHYSRNPLCYRKTDGLDILNFEGLSPVHIAASCGDISVLKLLIQAGANIDCPDGKSGKTALHHAVEAVDLLTAGYLLSEASADPNAKRYDGNTVLHFTCARGMVGMTSLLMAAGADPSVENDEFIDSADEDEQDGGSLGVTSRLKPADYAKGDEKILRILRGVPYTTADEIQEKRPIFSIDSEKPKLSSDFTIESGFATLSLKGEEIDRSQRADLVKVLNKNEDYLLLAEKLKMEEYIINSLKSATSPTDLLLDYYEMSDGTIDDLSKCLLELDMTEAAEILDRPESDGIIEPGLKKKKEIFNKQEKVDSGLDEMYIDSIDNGYASQSIGM